MEIKATNRSAALAGIWTVLGLIPFEAWMEHHKASSAIADNLLWLIAASVFFLVPGFLFVIGKDTGKFDRFWFLDSEQRQRYGVVTKRMIVWFFSAGFFGTIWSVVLTLIWPR